MNSEERDLISRFVARVGGGQVGFGQATPATLPPVDPEADHFIAENFQRYPEARYRITQLAVVQEAALAQAQNRIRELEFQLQQTRSQLVQQQGRAGQSGGFFSNLFGRGPSSQPQSPPMMPPRQAMPSGWGPAGAGAPGYAMPPGYQPGMFQRSGSGFLGSALSTAAGVAGGMMAANALEGLFSGHHATGDASNETITNNTYGDPFMGMSDATAEDPFGGSGTGADGFSQQDFGGSGDQAGEDFNGGWGNDAGDDSGAFDDDSMF